VNPDKHLTKDALILLATGNCSQSLSKEATAHFKSCEECLHEFEETRRVLTLVQVASERGLLALPREPQVKRDFVASRKFSFPWTQIATIVAVAIVAIFVICLPRAVPVASASKLLDRAVINEHGSRAPVAFDFLTHGLKCGRSKAGIDFLLAGESPVCQRAAASIKGTVWGTGNPLSANSFRTWHASLVDHHDSVKKLPDVWTIETSTSTGAIRDARFTLRQDTYRPLELYLQFNNREEITIEEDFNPFPDDSITNSLLPVKMRTPATSQSNNAANMLEVQAWQILHDLNGDTGWEARIVRSGEVVKIEAQVLTAARKEEFEHAFGLYPKIVGDIHEYGEAGARPNFLPYRSPDVSGQPALAHEWLEQQFQDPKARSQFVNRAVSLSKAILGRAYILGELQARRKDIAGCSCVHTLDGLIEKERAALMDSQSSLRSALEPLVGVPPQAVPKKITPAAARRLDTAVIKLLFAVPPGNTAPLDEGKNAVRQLL
jgi:hypothetical protein